MGVTNWLYICGGLILTLVLMVRIFVDLVTKMTGEPPK